MKHFLLKIGLMLSLCSLVLTLAHAQEPNFKVKLKITGVEGYTGAYLLTFNEQSNNYKAEPKDGVCTLTGYVSEPTVCRISLGNAMQLVKGTANSYLPYKCSSLYLIISPNDDLSITGDLTGKDFMDIYCRINDENKKFATYLSECYKPMNLHGRNAVYLMKNKDISAEEKAKIAKEQESYTQQQQQIRMDFLNRPEGSIGALWLMQDMLIRSQIAVEDLKPIFKKIDISKYGKSFYYKAVKQRLEASDLVAIGKPCPEIETNASYDGKLFNLRSLRGKYVILDFWGTWCGACLKGVPAMKAFRDKYADKIQILGIANDKNTTYWKKVIDARGMNWPHILIGKGELDYVSKFNVQGFPTKILIDPQGIIRYRSVGESNEFYNEVAKIIGGEVAEENCTITFECPNYRMKQLYTVAVLPNGVQRKPIEFSNGKATLKLAVSDVTRVLIQNIDTAYNIKTSHGYIPPIMADFYIAPNENLKVSFDNTTWPLMTIEGSDLAKDISRYKAIISPKEAEFRRLLKLRYQSAGEEQKRYDQQIAQIEKETSKARIDFILSNPKALYTLLLAERYYRSFSDSELDQVIQNLKSSFAGNTHFKTLEKAAERLKAVVVGAAAPSFTKKDKDGKTISLDQYKGKYLLLDFWGTWCGYCRKAHPHLVELHKKYAPLGLEIINVASEGKNANRQKWLDAIKKDGLVWTNILNDEDVKACNMVALYNISGFPTKVLINPEGKIQYIGVGSKTDIDQVLEKAFNEKK